MGPLFEEGTRKEERRGGVSGSFSKWLLLSYGSLFSYFHLFSLSYFCFSLVP